MNANPYRDPVKLLQGMVAAGCELIRARDSELAAGLDVAPPLVHPSGSPSHEFAAAGAARPRGIAYRAARKVYRKLKNTRVLQPVLERIRHEILIRRQD